MEYNNVQRMRFIDITKGIGIFLVVSSHTYGSLMSWALPCYIPLFFVASGFCTKQSVNLIGKFKKLIIPYFFFSFILLVAYKSFDITDFLGVLYSRWCIYPLGSDHNNYLLRSGNGPLWFLTSMYVSYILYWFIQQSSKQFWILALFFIISYILSYLPVLLPWSIDTAFLMSIFLYCGTLIRKKALLQKLDFKWMLNLILLYIILLFFCGNVNLSVRIYGRSLIILFPSALLGSILLMKFSKFIESCYMGKAFELIGRHSLSIFCLQIPFITLWNIIIEWNHTNIPPTINGILSILFVLTVTYPISLLLDKYLLRFITK